MCNVLRTTYYILRISLNAIVIATDALDWQTDPGLWTVGDLLRRGGELARWSGVQR